MVPLRRATTDVVTVVWATTLIGPLDGTPCLVGATARYAEPAGGPAVMDNTAAVI